MKYAVLACLTAVILQVRAAEAQLPGASAAPIPAPSAPSRSTTTRGQSPFGGGVPNGTLSAEPITLTIIDAIDRALANNLGVLLADDGITRARGARWKAMGDLLPNITGRVEETRLVTNLAAYGFPLPAGIPGIVGPFNLFDARVYLSQAIVDLRALRESRAEAHNAAAAQYDYKSARDTVVLVATSAYAQALAAAARVEAARSQRNTAQALYDQAVDLKRGGLVAGIDVLRAEVELATARQRVTSTENESEKAKLQLARLIGLPIGQTFTMSTELTNVAIPPMTLDSALERAYRTRPDYLAAVERVRAAEATRQAAAAEMLPSVRVNANYGDLGLSIPDSHSTFSVAGAVDVPLFQGRTRGRVLEADADLRSRRADAEDLKAAVYYDVRTALLDLEAGNTQLEVASRARQLAADQLTQARDRFAAGVAGNIEVVQAQAAVTLANDQYIVALYTTYLAKGSLIRAVGIAEETARQIFGGPR